MSDRTELIERLEKATGPDRELDGDIEKLRRPGCWVEHSVEVKAHFGAGHGWIVPFFTSSLDAAMTLVPEGFAFGVGRDSKGDPHARVFGHDVHTEADHAATAAVALCIVALKAQETQSNG